MSKKLFVDTSGWVALFGKNDKYHQDAARIYGDIKKTGAVIYTSDYVLDETITTIRMNSNFHQSMVAMNAILESQMTTIIYINPDFFNKSTQLYQKYKDHPFSFTDITSFVICEHLKLKDVLSFDEHFRIAGFNLID